MRDIKISMVEMAVFLLERMLKVEETSQTATRTRGNTLGVGDMSTMAIIKTHRTEAYMDWVGKNETYLGMVGKSVSGMEMVQTLGLELL